MSKTTSSARNRIAAPPIAEQQAIAEQTAAFLAQGGKIQRIPRGVSGQLQNSGARYGGRAAAVKKS